MTLFIGDCEQILEQYIAPGTIHLTVTSPPYDSARDYAGTLNDWNEDKWKSIITGLYRVSCDGGVVVWIVSDETKNGTESGTSFRQALWAKEVGFNIHDTMIWLKPTFSAVGALKVRYAPVFEYMFVFSKGKPRVFNPIKDRENKSAGMTRINPTIRNHKGEIIKNKSATIADYGQRFNVWEHGTVSQKGDNVHPAPFPVGLVEDHIKSWSNPGDLVLDPFMGSGTTGVASKNLGRNFIGIERESSYFEMAHARIYGMNSDLYQLLA